MFECRNLVRNRDIASSPCLVVAPRSKIVTKLFRCDIAGLITRNNAQPVEPELMDQRRFAVANRVADNVCIRDHVGKFPRNRK